MGANKSRFLLAENPNPEKYLGLWYEIARKPFEYEDPNSSNTTASYSMNYDGSLCVENSTIVNGKRKTSIGKAVPKNGNWSHLRVSFFIGAWADYRIILLDKNYRYSVVSNEDDSVIWILSRTPYLKEIQNIIDDLVNNHGIVNDFIFPLQGN